MNEMSELLYENKASLDKFKGWVKLAEDDEALRNSEKWYEMTREEQMVLNMQKTKRYYEIDREKYFHSITGNEYSFFYNVNKGMVKILF
jgi:hypothetical protein